MKENQKEFFEANFYRCGKPLRNLHPPKLNLLFIKVRLGSFLNVRQFRLTNV